MSNSSTNLSADNEFSIHAAAYAVKRLSRDELEESFVDMLHQKFAERQIFLQILKDHGIDADLSYSFASNI